MQHHHTNVGWTAEEVERLRAAYPTTSKAELARIFGKSPQAIATKCWRLGLNTKVRPITDEEKAIVREWYARAEQHGDLNVRGLAKHLGRSEASISALADRLELRQMGRKKGAEYGKAISVRQRQWHATHDHPRGALGMTHSAEARAKMSVHSKAVWSKKLPLDRELMMRKAVQTRIERYGTGGPVHLQAENAYSRTKRGRREDLNNQYFRSAWEANYARYLTFLQERGEIASWAYEPKTFVFHGVTHGVLTYLPDFEVVERDGRATYHEVKGWMDPKSKAKLKRMAKYYPEVRIVLIDQDAYRAIARWSGMIPGWEH